MNKYTTAFVLVTAGMFGSQMALADVNGGSGTLSLSANITDTTCAIVTTPNSGMNQTVTFDHVDSLALAGLSANATVDSKAFTLPLTGCPDNITSADLAFDYTPFEPGSHLMENSGTGKGATFGVADKSDATVSEALAPGGKLISTIANGTGAFNGYGILYRTSESVVAGSLSSAANVSLTFN